MDELFQYCVDILKWIAEVFGISYEAANIYIFIVIYPLVVIILIAYIFYLRYQLRQLIQ
jgi:hypothetical protein